MESYEGNPERRAAAMTLLQSGLEVSEGLPFDELVDVRTKKSKMAKLKCSPALLIGVKLILQFKDYIRRKKLTEKGLKCWATLIANKKVRNVLENLEVPASVLNDTSNFISPSTISAANDVNVYQLQSSLPAGGKKERALANSIAAGKGLSKEGETRGHHHGGKHVFRPPLLNVEEQLPPQQQQQLPYTGETREGQEYVVITVPRKYLINVYSLVAKLQVCWWM